MGCVGEFANVMFEVIPSRTRPWPTRKNVRRHGKPPCLLKSVREMKAGQAARVTKVEPNEVAQARQKSGLSQTQYAEALGISGNRMAKIDTTSMIPAEDVGGEDAEERRLLRERAQEARGFMAKFRWCRSIRRLWFAGGFSHVAVFFCELENSAAPSDNQLWVVVGDLPPAYLVVDGSPDVKAALLSYIHEMRLWVDAAKNGLSVADCIPVNVAATPENAGALESRLEFIEKEYVPSLP
jgi:hypothetical protein